MYNHELLVCSLVVACAATACHESPAPSWRVHGAALDDTVKRIAALEGHLAGASVEGPVRVRRRAAPWFRTQPAELFNAGIIYEQDFDDLVADKARMPVYRPDLDESWLRLPARALEGRIVDVARTNQAAALMRQLRYVLVVRSERFVPPMIKQGQFVPGVIDAEAHLYAIEGEHLGAFTIKARNSHRIAAALGREALVEDLSMRHAFSLYAGIVDHIPGAVPP